MSGEKSSVNKAMMAGTTKVSGRCGKERWVCEWPEEKWQQKLRNPRRFINGKNNLREAKPIKLS